MKYKFLNLLFFCFLSVWAMAQRQQVVGVIISDENAEVVQLASILNKVSGQKAVSNRQGYFRIQVFPTDTVRFSAIGFETIQLSGMELLSQQAGDTVKLLMHSTSYKLKDVTIVYSNRKRDSIARAAAQFLKNDPLMNNNDRILNRPRGSGFSGVLTEMYYQFSKSGQDMVRFEEFVKYYRAVQAADLRYNKEVIKRVTNLPDYTLDDFILFCKMDRKFILTASDYDLIKAIQDCGDRYKSANGIRR